jgi:thiamine kinase-like enzyme
VDGLERVFERVPWLHADGPPERLAGLTNINYRIGECVVRLPGAGTSEYISRADEEVAARSAAAAGVNVDVLFFDASDGLMVTRFAEGAVTMTPQRFADDRGAIGRAGAAMRRLHTTAEPFANEFDAFAVIDDYRTLLASKSSPLPDGFDDVQAAAQAARMALAANPVEPAPCHCDPLCENFLDNGDSMFLIDYEYAGNNDPMWDLGDFSVEAELDLAADELLLASYFDGAAPPHDVARMVIHKAVCDLLWSLWGVVQHVNENPVEDFWAYAVGRFERCHRLMQTDQFAGSVDLLAHRAGR